MTHFGIICPAMAGHLYPMTTLGYELKKRGHRVTLLGILDAKPKATAAELEFQAVGESDFPAGATKDLYIKLGNLSGAEALKYTFNWVTNTAKMYLRDAPKSAENLGIESLLVDQATPEGGSVAEHLGIPFVSICSALMLNREINVPPFCTVWDYDTSHSGLERNRLGYERVNGLGKTLRKITNDYRISWGLPIREHPNEFYSQLAQIAQHPQEFEFPRKELPQYFHFIGSCYNPNLRQAISFPYEQLNGKPIVYASLGTLQNRLLWIFKAIAEACIKFDVQLIIALGGGASPGELPKMPGDPIIVGYAPQLELLQKATLTITHAGLNTTLESLSQGVPLVAIPITNEQPGVAARIAWTGTGKFVPLEEVSADNLQQAIEQVLTDDSYKKNALKLQEAIKQSGGVSRAVDIIEQVAVTSQPVLA